MATTEAISPNFVNRTMWTGDNLNIMRGLNSETVDLIYLDPPFNSNANYAAPIGSRAAGAAFTDTWSLSDIDEAWCTQIKFEHSGLWHYLMATKQIHSKSQMSYLIYMAPRLIEMKRLLKDTGSIYLHCDPTASHYLKAMMDAIFWQGKLPQRGDLGLSHWRREQDLLAQKARHHFVICQVE